jgi:hypothetical protein
VTPEDAARAATSSTMRLATASASVSVSDMAPVVCGAREATFGGEVGCFCCQLCVLEVFSSDGQVWFAIADRTSVPGEVTRGAEGVIP